MKNTNNHKFGKSYIIDKSSGILKRAKDAAFSYSNGNEAEDALYKALKRTKDRSVHSPAIYALQHDWVSTYHLSSQRANLLRPLEKTVLAGARVLELGCGCGGISRYLAETAQTVIAVEGSFKRAQIAAARCKGLENITFIADAIQKLPKRLGSFDVVTLIGVLEYARIYGGGKGAELRLLEKARSFLKPGGILVLALENKLGLKYFAGVAEDHLGTPWTGVMGAYAEEGVVTFSRKELQAMLHEAGFSFSRQFIASPDYKLPTTVIHPQGLLAGDDEFDKGALFCTQRRDYEEPPLFNMQATWKSVCSAGLLPELSDSLCFIAGQSEHCLESAWEENILASHYGWYLPKAYAKEVRFQRTDQGINVLRRHLYPDSGTRKHVQNLDDESYAQGTLLLDLMRQVIVRPGWEHGQLVEVLKPWLLWLEERKLPGTDKVKDSLIDATPYNIVVTGDGKLVYIDQEWGGRKKIDFSIVLLRTLANALSLLGVCAPPAPGTSVIYYDIICSAFNSLGMSLKKDKLQNMLDKATALSTDLTGQKKAKAEIFLKYSLTVIPENTSSIYNNKDILQQTTIQLHHSQGAVAALQYERQSETSLRIDAESRLALANDKLANAEIQLSATEAQLSATEAQLSATSDQLSNTEAQLSSAEAQLSSAEAQLSSAEAQLSSAEAQLSSTSNQLSATEGQLAETANKLATAENTLAALKTRQEEITRELAGMYNSRSWKITRPLRKIMGGIRLLHALVVQAAIAFFLLPAAFVASNALGLTEPLQGKSFFLALIDAYPAVLKHIRKRNIIIRAVVKASLSIALALYGTRSFKAAICHIFYVLRGAAAFPEDPAGNAQNADQDESDAVL